MFEKVTATFLVHSAGPDQVNDDNVATLERCTILLYDRTSSLVNVDEARKQLFTKKGCTMDAIPPTRAALVQHIKRAVYQGGIAGVRHFKLFLTFPHQRTGDEPTPVIGNPYGQLCQKLPLQQGKELLCCGCKKGCRGQCKCKKAALKCTALCRCGGECNEE